MQANGYLLPANGATNHAQARPSDGRGSGEKAKPSNRVRLNGNIVRRNPGKRIREYARLATALRDYEAEQPLYVAAIRLLIFTGARCGEIEQLRWEWVQEPRLMLPDSKTGAKIVYLNRQAIDLIAALPGRKPTGLLFPSFRNSNKPITLGIHWSKIRNRAALPDVRLHDLRHSFASVAIRDNISLMVIGKLLGHALAETTTRYAHLSDEIVADAAERVSGSIARLIGVGQ